MTNREDKMSRIKDTHYKVFEDKEYEILTFKEFEGCELTMPNTYDGEIEYIEHVAVHWDEFKAQLERDFGDTKLDADKGDFEAYVEEIGQEYVGDSRDFPSRTCPDVRFDIDAITIACDHIGSDYVYFKTITEYSVH